MNIYELLEFAREQIRLVKTRPYINTHRIEKAKEALCSVRLNLKLHTDDPKQVELIEAYKEVRKEFSDLKRTLKI